MHSCCWDSKFSTLFYFVYVSSSVTVFFLIIWYKHAINYGWKSCCTLECMSTHGKPPPPPPPPSLFSLYLFLHLLPYLWVPFFFFNHVLFIDLHKIIKRSVHKNSFDVEKENSSSSNWILMSCQPHRVTSGQSNSGYKQIHISKLLTYSYINPSVKSIYKTNHFSNTKHTYINIRHKFLKS